jgi:ribosomal protein S27AE
VLSVGQDEVVLVVRHQSVILPPSYLEIVGTRPSKWVVPAQEHYAVCPNCAERVALGTPPERMRCGRCSGIFDFELKREGPQAH